MSLETLKSVLKVGSGLESLFITGLLFRFSFVENGVKLLSIQKNFKCFIHTQPQAKIHILKYYLDLYWAHMKIILSMKSNIVGVNLGQVINWLKVCAALLSSLATVISEYSLYLLLN